MMGQSLGLFISAAIPDVFTAQSLSFVLLLGLMLFGETAPPLPSGQTPRSAVHPEWWCH